MEGRPYITASMMKTNVGKVVSVIGKVIDVSPSGNQLRILMSGNKEVKVALRDTLEEMLEGFVQITANVQGDGSLVAENIISFGSGEIDLQLYDEAVQLTSKYPELFTCKQANGISY